jgi:hypothetical protein
MFRKLYLTCCLFCTAYTLYAQQFVIKRVELLEGRVILHYDLADSIKARSYTINAYSSLDNFVTPLQKVTGDIGVEVKPGFNKKVVWDAPAELGTMFSGKVSVEIRGRLFIPFIKLDRFEDYKTFKRGKPYTIAWTGGRSSTIMNWDLYKGDEKITTFPNIANSGHVDLTIPASVKPGLYTLKISDTKNKDEEVNTTVFRVKRKVPLLLKVIPVLGIGAAVASMSGGGESDSKEIVLPPNPPPTN